MGLGTASEESADRLGALQLHNLPFRTEAPTTTHFQQESMSLLPPTAAHYPAPDRGAKQRNGPSNGESFGPE